MDQNPDPTPQAEPGPPATPEAAAAPPHPTSAAATVPPPPPATPQPPVAPPAPPPGYTWDAPNEPAGPAPGFRFASHGGRLIAYIIDGIIIAILLTVLSLIGVVFLAVGSTGDFNDPDTLTLSAISIVGITILSVVGIVVGVGYFPWFWARAGQTPGMKLFRLRVVRDRDGGPISGGQAVIRLIGLWISGAVFYLGYVWILIDSRRRGWHDLLAGTCMIETD